MNPHSLSGHMALNHARLPIPPRSRLVENDGLEPPTPCTSSKCSPAELILLAAYMIIALAHDESQDKLSEIFLFCKAVEGKRIEAAKHT